MHPKREFPYQVVRMGEQGSKYFTPVRCCRCGTEKVFESFKALPDEVISKRYSQWGWVMGRNRGHDICPPCIGVRPENRLAARFKVISEGEEVECPQEVAKAAALRLEQEAKAVRKAVFNQPTPKDIIEVLKKVREENAEIKTLLSMTVALLTKQAKRQSELGGDSSRL